jgi:hypothetical protein
MPFSAVIPAKAGIQSSRRDLWPWIPAFAGMTAVGALLPWDAP